MNADHSGHVGRQGTAALTVGPEHTAAAVGSGSLAVFATPVLVALMEQAACACLDGLLPEAETSVGVKVAAEHTAPTPVGATVTAVATITAWEGRTVDFAIEASDQAGPVGQAEHTRAVVDGARLLAKAQTRA